LISVYFIRQIPREPFFPVGLIILNLEGEYPQSIKELLYTALGISMGEAFGYYEKGQSLKLSQVTSQTSM
jgi:hypothetical protein